MPNLREYKQRDNIKTMGKRNSKKTVQTEWKSYMNIKGGRGKKKKGTQEENSTNSGKKYDGGKKKKQWGKNNSTNSEKSLQTLCKYKWWSENMCPNKVCPLTRQNTPPSPHCVPSDSVSQSATVSNAHFVVHGLVIMNSK